ncbi:hypothetical protein MKEN_01000300 [Mycena kentingensis (nom. inval.)]|nr:hypothetical protein MKEN_01000300 [Mycena kentingensis (nom. inval.)]
MRSISSSSVLAILLSSCIRQTAGLAVGPLPHRVAANAGFDVTSALEPTDARSRTLEVVDLWPETILASFDAIQGPRSRLLPRATIDDTILAERAPRLVGSSYNYDDMVSVESGTPPSLVPSSTTTNVPQEQTSPNATPKLSPIPSASAAPLAASATAFEQEAHKKIILNRNALIVGTIVLVGTTAFFGFIAWTLCGCRKRRQDPMAKLTV